MPSFAISAHEQYTVSLDTGCDINSGLQAVIAQSACCLGAIDRCATIVAKHCCHRGRPLLERDGVDLHRHAGRLSKMVRGALSCMVVKCGTCSCSRPNCRGGDKWGWCSNSVWWSNGGKKKFVIANKSIDTCPFPLPASLHSRDDCRKFRTLPATSYHLQRLSVLHFSHFLQSMEPLVLVGIDLSWLYRAA